MELGYLIAKGILKPWLRMWFRWTVEGAENIPERGPALIACNHISFLDPLALAYVVDERGRHPRFLAKTELFEDRRIGWILRSARQIEVRRGTREAPLALDQAISSLEAGEVVVMFPEGTVTTDPDLNPMRPKTGLSRLALMAQAPILPAGVWGTQNIWPKGHPNNWAPRQDVLVRIGEPMTVSGDPVSRDDWRRIGAEVTDEIAKLVASIRPAVPDRRRPKKPAA